MPGSGITDREIQSLREAQLQYMPSTGRVYRLEKHDRTMDYGPFGGVVSCRVTPGFATIWRLVADRYQGMVAFSLTMPWDTDIVAGDKFYDAYGREFMVRAVKQGSTYSTALQVLGELIEEGSDG